MTYIGSLSGGQTSTSTGSALSLLGGSGGGISGLASGINTDSIVSGLMAAADVPLVGLLQQRQVLQWREQQYQQVNQSLTALQSSASSLRLQSTFLTKSVVSSNSSVATGTATSLAAAGTYNLSVQQLAQGATVASSSSLSTSTNYGTTLLSAMGVTGTSVTLQFSGGSAFTFNPATTSINDVVSAINSDTASNTSAFYDANSGKVVLQTATTGSAAKIQVAQDTGNLMTSVFRMSTAPNMESTALQNGVLNTGGTVEINGTKFAFSAGTTVASMVSTINLSTSATGVTASVDVNNNQLVLQGTNLYSPISLSDPNSLSNGSTVLGLTPQSTTTNTSSHDAYYTVNGYATTSPNNSPTFAGVSLNLVGTGSVALSVTNNTDAVVQQVMDFVKQYNTTLQTMQGFYNQQRNYDYQPLTSQQASQMTQTQIDQWNQKAQSGLLSGDTLLGSSMNSMETAMSSIVNGQSTSVVNSKTVTLNSLSAIGIQPFSSSLGVDSGYTAPGVTTTGWNTYGLLEVNQAQLTVALQADPNSVMRMFTNDPSTSLSGTVDPTQTGVAVSLYTSLTNSITSIGQQAGTSLTGSAPSTTAPLPYTAIDPNADFTALFASDGLDTSFLGSQLNSLDSQSTNMQQQLNMLKQRYQDQFTQMETAMSQLNNQSGALGSMLGTSSSSSSSSTGH